MPIIRSRREGHRSQRDNRPVIKSDMLSVQSYAGIPAHLGGQFRFPAETKKVLQLAFARVRSSTAPPSVNFCSYKSHGAACPSLRATRSASCAEQRREVLQPKRVVIAGNVSSERPESGGGRCLVARYGSCFGGCRRRPRIVAWDDTTEAVGAGSAGT